MELRQYLERIGYTGAVAPDFPTLMGFLDYWERELDGPLHSVRVAHHRLIGPHEWRNVDGIISMQ